MNCLRCNHSGTTIVLNDVDMCHHCMTPTEEKIYMEIRRKAQSSQRIKEIMAQRADML